MKISNEVIRDMQKILRDKQYLLPTTVLNDALSAVLPKLMVKVKNMEWVQDEHGSIEFTAQSMFGEYSVHIERKSAYECSLDGVKYERININHPYTVDQAKAAAQADYERRKLEGLEIVKSDVDVAAVREQCRKAVRSAILHMLPDHRVSAEICDDIIAKTFRALSSEPAQGEQWQPIEIAPVDQTSEIERLRGIGARIIAAFDPETELDSPEKFNAYHDLILLISKKGRA